MAFPPKDWKDSPDATTPISAAGLENLETRLSTYTDEQIAIEDARYQIVVSQRAAVFASAASATYVIAANDSSMALASASASALGVVYLDPADLVGATGKTAMYKLDASLMQNATAPTVTFTVGLYPVSAAAGGAGASTITLGTVTGGSTVAFTTPTASTRNQGSSGEFTAPAAGYYAIGVVSSGSQAANSRTVISARLSGHLA